MGCGSVRALVRRQARCSLGPALAPLRAQRGSMLCHSSEQVRELKQILEERGIGMAGLAEKGELVDRILERCSNVTYYA